MENEALVDEMIALITQIMEMAGPEWTMEALQGLLEAVQQGGEQEMPAQGSAPPSGAPQAKAAPMGIPPMKTGLGMN